MYYELDQRDTTVRAHLEKDRPKNCVGGYGNEKEPICTIMIWPTM